MRYDPSIQSHEHEAFCRAHAEKAYKGKLIRDEFGMLLVRDARGLSTRTRCSARCRNTGAPHPPCMSVSCSASAQPYVQAAFDENQRKP